MLAQAKRLVHAVGDRVAGDVLVGGYFGGAALVSQIASQRIPEFTHAEIVIVGQEPQMPRDELACSRWILGQEGGQLHVLVGRHRIRRRRAADDEFFDSAGLSVASSKPCQSLADLPDRYPASA